MFWLFSIFAISMPPLHPTYFVHCSPSLKFHHPVNKTDEGWTPLLLLIFIIFKGVARLEQCFLGEVSR